MLIGMFVRGEEIYFRQILMTGNKEAETVELFEAQREAFFNRDGERLPEVEFTPGRTRETEATAYVDGCSDVDDFIEAAENWATVPLWNLETDLPCIKAAFVKSDKTDEILVQLIERRRVIVPKTGWFSGGDGNTLEESVQYSLHWDVQLLAVIRGSRLFFKSFSYTNRVFDLSDFMQEASAETAHQLLTLSNIGVEGVDVDTAVRGLSKLQLRRIPKILALGYVNRYTADELAVRALNTKKRLRFKVENGKLLMPLDPKERDQFLLFLAGRIVSSYMDDENDYETDSVRKL